MVRPEEMCVHCGDTTGRAGVTEDSLYITEALGPLCESCWTIATAAKRQGAIESLELLLHVDCRKVLPLSGSQEDYLRERLTELREENRPLDGEKDAT